MSLKGKGPILLGAIAISALAAYSAFNYIYNKKDSDEILLPALTQEETEDAMQKILSKLLAFSKKLFEIGENIKAQVRQQGHDVDDKTVFRSYLLPHFETQFREAQETILNELDCEEVELEEAVNYYDEHGSVILKDIKERIRTIYKQFGGDIDDDNNNNNGNSNSENNDKDMTLDEVLGALKSLNDKVESAGEGFIKQFKEKYGVPDSAELLQAFQEGFLTLTTNAEMEVLMKYGISNDVFSKNIMKYQESPLINKAINDMQLSQHKLLHSNGIQF